MADKPVCCKHFRGVQNKLCGAGINMRDITGGPAFGWARRMPCLVSNNSQVTCTEYSEQTPQEIEAEEAEREKHFEKFKLAQPLIREIRTEHEGKSWEGIKKCPCCGGKLFLSHSSYNGHVHGECETEGCLKWME